ncbi:MAG TPA: hypothetical protein VG389_02130 [Myxococcota bacterium]|nr:hypothetical protein [Myxococcota bacterium]
MKGGYYTATKKFYAAYKKGQVLYVAMRKAGYKKPPPKKHR